MSHINTLRALLGSLATLFLATACTDTKLAFTPVPVACEVPPTSAKFGVNPGPVIFHPTADTVVSGKVSVTGSCVSGLPVVIEEVSGKTTTVECKQNVFATELVLSEGDGTKDLMVSQKSAADGSEIVDRMCFMKDSVPPAVTITSGNSAQSTNSTSTVVSGVCETGLPVMLWGPGLSTPVSTECVNGSFSTTIQVNPGDGTKDIVGGQVDRAGNQGLASSSVSIDTAPPVVRITSLIPLVTNLSSLVVSGTCEAGLPLEIGEFRATTAPAVTCTNGTFVANIPLSGVDGVAPLRVFQVDTAGNIGFDSKNTIKDTTGPAVTISLPLANALLAPNSTFSGACEAGLPVALSGSVLSAAASVPCSSGQWTLTIAVAAGEGSKNLIASQVDGAGNIGQSQQSFVVDRTAPILAFTSPAENSYVGTSFDVAGVCETGLAVQLSGTGLLPSTTTACTNGKFMALVNASPLDGSKEVLATQTDAAGNVATANRIFLRDTLAPRLTINSPAAGTYVGATFVLTGTCEAGLEVNFSGAGLANTSAATCTSAGTYSATLVVSAGDGSKSILVKESDAAGNISTASINYLKDATAPLVAITSPVVNTVAQSGLTVAGTCEAGLDVTLAGSGVAAAVVTSCSPQGAFSAAITYSSGGGTKLVTASQTDLAGNVGTDSRSFVSDSTPPTITITAPAENSYVPATFAVQGACETGFPVIVGGAGLVAEVSVVCAAGTYSANGTVSAGDGSKLVTAKQTDAGGNTATASSTYLRDTAAPLLTITSPTNGTVAQNGLELTGACETGLTVSFSGAGVAASSSVVCTAGTFQTDLILSDDDGAKVITVSETDAAGNRNEVSGTYVRDTTAPVVAITSPAVDTAAQNGLTVAGTCEAGLNVTLAGAGVQSPVVVPCNANGIFSGDISFSAGSGPKLVTAAQTDAVGNTGSGSRRFVRDLVLPAVTITSPAAGSYLAATFLVQGACETGLPVTVGGAGIVSATTVSCTAGAYSANVSVSSGDGTKNVTAQQTDLAGNVGLASQNYLRDTTAPLLTITSPVNGTVAQNGVELNGTCETGLSVVFSGAGISASSSVTCVTGTYQANLTFSANDGAKVINVSETDAAGNSTQVLGTYLRDTTAPAIAITSPAAGTSAQNGLTVGGTCEAGLDVTLAGSGVLTPVVVACSASGAFTADISFSASSGTKLVTASQTDALGITGTSSRSFVRDLVAPSVTITSPAANSYLASNFTVQGACETGLQVTVAGAGINAAATVACTAGAYSANVAVSSGDGTKNVTAQQTDLAGNVGQASQNYLRDTLAPILTITSPASGTVAKDGVQLVGTCETGLTVVFAGAGVSSPSSVVCTAGSYQADISFSANDGSKSITVSETDAAGNKTEVSGVYLRDMTAPVVAITSPAAGTSAQNGLTVGGTCEAGLDVTLAGSGVLAPVVVACSGGVFSGDITFSAGSGSKLVLASQTDALGNSGSGSRTFVRDLTVPAVTITSPAANSYLGTTFAVQGACETGLQVTLSGAGLSAPVTATCTAGAYSGNVAVSSGDGTKNVIAQQTDLAGNVGQASQNYLRDTLAPLLTITLPANGTIAKNGVQMVGTCETGLTVVFSGAGLASSSSVVCAAGTYQADLNFSANDGSKVITVSETDAAGNKSEVTGSYVRDTGAPTVTIASPSKNTYLGPTATLQGVCETGLEVTLSGAGLSAPVTVPCAAGAYSANVTLSSGDGTKIVTAQQTDLSGNVGQASQTYLRDTVAPLLTITSPANGTIAQNGVQLIGTCETGLTVVFTGAGVVSSTSVVCAAGAYQVNLSFSANDGVKVITVSETDAAGNTSQVSGTFVRDTTAPVVAITSPAAGTPAQLGLTVGGTCEAGLNVTLSGAGVLTPVFVACSAGGSFSGDIQFSLGSGSKLVTASQTDAVGNTGSGSRSFVLDLTSPAVTIASPAANTYLGPNFTVQGACETGLQVTLGGAGLSAPVTATCTAGAYSANVSVSSGDGTKNVTAQQTDFAGNVGQAAKDYLRDTAAPVLTITSPANGTVAKDGVTLVGTCETGLTVVFSGAGVASSSSVVCASGAYQANIGFSADDGSKLINVSETDAAGNTSQVSGTYLRDMTAPLVAITSPAENTPAKEGLTVGGTCEAGLNVTLAGSGVASAVVVPCTAGGNFSGAISFSAGSGAKLITASQTDAVGNTGTGSRSFVRDLTVPAVTITSPAANTYLATNFSVQGACESGLDVTVGGAGVSATMTVPCAGGVYSALVTVSSGDGTKTVTAQQIDLAGNVGQVSQSYLRDTTAPALAITSPVSGSSVAPTVSLIGTCETGRTVSVIGDLTNTSGSCTAGAFNIAISFSAGLGVKSVVVRQTDIAGNVGQATAQYSRDSDAASETFVSDASFGKIDILFIDDNSASMDPNQASLGAKFSGFASELLNIDWQIGITTTDCSTGPYGICGSLLNLTGTNSKILTPSTPDYQTVFNNSIKRPETVGCLNTGTCPSGASEPLLSATTAMNKFNTDNAGFFRSNSDLAIVILTDADERQTGGATYADRPEQLVAAFGNNWPAGKKLKVYSIIVKPGDSACLATMRAGSGGFSFYGALVEETVNLTGGLNTSICAPDYSVTLKGIGESVRTLTNSVELAHTPIAGSVVVTFTPNQNITYKVIGTKVVFDSPPSVGTEIKVDYQY